MSNQLKSKLLLSEPLGTKLDHKGIVGGAKYHYEDGKITLTAFNGEPFYVVKNGEVILNECNDVLPLIGMVEIGKHRGLPINGFFVINNNGLFTLPVETRTPLEFIDKLESRLQKIGIENYSWNDFTIRKFIESTRSLNSEEIYMQGKAVIIIKDNEEEKYLADGVSYDIFGEPGYVESILESTVHNPIASEDLHSYTIMAANRRSVTKSVYVEQLDNGVFQKRLSKDNHSWKSEYKTFYEMDKALEENIFDWPFIKKEILKTSRLNLPLERATELNDMPQPKLRSIAREHRLETSKKSTKDELVKLIMETEFQGIEYKTEIMGIDSDINNEKTGDIANKISDIKSGKFFPAFKNLEKVTFCNPNNGKTESLNLREWRRDVFNIIDNSNLEPIFADSQDEFNLLHGEFLNSRLNFKNPTVGDQFEDWFHGSQVTEENGDPKVLYHGTTEKFQKFIYGDIGFHFGSLSASVNRLKSKIDDNGNQANARIIPVYLSIKNPLRMPDAGDWDNEDSIANALAHALNEDDVLYKKYEDNLGEGDSIKDVLVKMGFDGIVYENVAEGGGDSYIAFQASQIRNAKIEPEAAIKTGVISLDNTGLIVGYHGSDTEIETINASEVGTFGSGIYFTDAMTDATAYGDRVYRAGIKLENPWVIQVDHDSDGAEYFDLDHPAVEPILSLSGGWVLLQDLIENERLLFDNKLTELVEDLGHDGIIAIYPDKSKEIVVFDPQSIKSFALASELKQSESASDKQSESTAELEIRSAFKAASMGKIDQWVPFHVTYNGSTQSFLGKVKKLPPMNSRLAPKIHLLKISNKEILDGVGIHPVSELYELDGKNKLDYKGVPYHSNDDEIAIWNKEFGTGLVSFTSYLKQSDVLNNVNSDDSYRTTSEASMSIKELFNNLDQSSIDDTMIDLARSKNTKLRAEIISAIEGLDYFPEDHASISEIMYSLGGHYEVGMIGNMPTTKLKAELGLPDLRSGVRIYAHQYKENEKNLFDFYLHQSHLKTNGAWVLINSNDGHVLINTVSMMVVNPDPKNDPVLLKKFDSITLALNTISTNHNYPQEFIDEYVSHPDSDVRNVLREVAVEYLGNMIDKEREINVARFESLEELIGIEAELQSGNSFYTGTIIRNSEATPVLKAPNQYGRSIILPVSWRVEAKGIENPLRKEVLQKIENRTKPDIKKVNESEINHDVSYRNDGLFTTFFADTPAGENVIREILKETDGSGKILNVHVPSVIQQILDAGYIVGPTEEQNPNLDELYNQILTTDEADLFSNVVNPVTTTDSLPLPTKFRDGVNQHIELEIEQLPLLGVAKITDVGSENIYIEKDGLNYFCKVGSTEKYTSMVWDFYVNPNGNRDLVLEHYQNEYLPNPVYIFEQLDKNGDGLKYLLDTAMVKTLDKFQELPLSKQAEAYAEVVVAGYPPVDLSGLSVSEVKDNTKIDDLLPEIENSIRKPNPINVPDTDHEHHNLAKLAYRLAKEKGQEITLNNLINQLAIVSDRNWQLDIELKNPGLARGYRSCFIDARSVHDRLLIDIQKNKELSKKIFHIRGDEALHILSSFAHYPAYGLDKKGWEDAIANSNYFAGLISEAKAVNSDTNEKGTEHKMINAWEMTRQSYIEAMLKNNPYKDIYEQSPESAKGVIGIYKDDWKNGLFERAKNGPISAIAIDDYVSIYGKQALNDFRGVYEIGIKEYMPKIESELVDDSNPIENLRASVAGMDRNEKLATTILDVLELMSDVMNGAPGFPEGQEEAAEDLIELLTAAVDGEGDYKHAFEVSAALFDEWLKNSNISDSADEIQMLVLMIKSSGLLSCSSDAKPKQEVKAIEKHLGNPKSQTESIVELAKEFALFATGKQITNERHINFAAAYIQKDAARLKYIANGCNDNALSFFCKIAGIEKPTTPAAALSAIESWAGHIPQIPESRVSGEKHKVPNVAAMPTIDVDKWFKEELSYVLVDGAWLPDYDNIVDRSHEDVRVCFIKLLSENKINDAVYLMALASRKDNLIAYAKQFLIEAQSEEGLSFGQRKELKEFTAIIIKEDFEMSNDKLFWIAQTISMPVAVTYCSEVDRLSPNGAYIVEGDGSVEITFKHGGESFVIEAVDRSEMTNKLLSNHSLISEFKAARFGLSVQQWNSVESLSKSERNHFEIGSSSELFPNGVLLRYENTPEHFVYISNDGHVQELSYEQSKTVMPIQSLLSWDAKPSLMARFDLTNVQYQQHHNVEMNSKAASLAL